MIDNEASVFSIVSETLREVYDKIFIIGEEITSAPSVFPAVSIVQTNNCINDRYSTFNECENVVSEEYKIEVYSNLVSERSAQTKEITAIISEAMDVLGYKRIYCNPVINADATISRRVSRFAKSNVINEDLNVFKDKNGQYVNLINNGAIDLSIDKDGYLIADFK